MVKNRGVKVSEADYGVILDSSNVLAAEPGKLYGWKDRWAVRFVYGGKDDKEQTLMVSFDRAEGQASFAALLRKAGLIVGGGLSRFV